MTRNRQAVTTGGIKFTRITLDLDTEDEQIIKKHTYAIGSNKSTLIRTLIKAYIIENNLKRKYRDGNNS